MWEKWQHCVEKVKIVRRKILNCEKKSQKDIPMGSCEKLCENKSKLWEEKFELWEKDKIGGEKSQNCEKKVKIVRINVKKVIIS